MSGRRNVVVAGTGFKNSDGKSRSAYIRRFCKKGAEVRLTREPDNEHDPNAIAVYLAVKIFWVWTVPVQIGYANATAAHRLAKVMDSGVEIKSKIANVWAPPELNHPEVSITIDY